MPRKLAVLAAAAVVVVLVGSVGYARLRPSEPAPQPQALAQTPVAAASEARWTTVPTPVTGDAAYQRLAAVERPEDINPAPPRPVAAPPVETAAVEAEPETTPPQPLTAEACRRPDADRAACRALRQREARRAQARAQAQERQRPPVPRRAPEPVSSAALGVSPNYDLMQR
jgi:hypothetical protein